MVVVFVVVGLVVVVVVGSSYGVSNRVACVVDVVEVTVWLWMVLNWMVLNWMVLNEMM